MKVSFPLSIEEAEMISFMLERAAEGFASKPLVMEAWSITNTDLARVHRARKRLVKSIADCSK